MATKKKKKTTPRKKSSSRSSKKTATAAKKPVEMLLVGSKVRQAVKDAGCNFGGDALEGLNTWVLWLVTQATARAQANGRKTVRAHDFMVNP